MMDTTLTSILARRLAVAPKQIACRYFSSDGSSTPVSLESLLMRSSDFANHFGLATHDRKVVAICGYSSIDLHAAFLGAIWAGHIPTMLPPPSPTMDAAKYSRSFASMIEHVKPAFLVLDRESANKLASTELLNEVACPLVFTDQVSASSLISPFESRADDVALLQHSSGTTGMQKGVALTHHAILNHNRAYREALGVTNQDVVVYWLPLYHDLGLINCFLFSLLSGNEFVELSPFSWVAKPSLLFEAIERHRGSVCFQPNFAFSFLAKATPSDRSFSLQSMRAWVSCGERVLDATFQEFLARFSSSGVRVDQLSASYAMAENVCVVSQSKPGSYRVVRADPDSYSQGRIAPSEAASALAFVSNGVPLETTEVRVVDQARHSLREGLVGEFAIRGHHLFSGYFGRPDLTAQSMSDDGWYLTGDIGFILDSELYVADRKKDILIVRGQNIYPSDVEATAGLVEGTIAGRLVAFGALDPSSGTEQVVILTEIDQARWSERELVIGRVAVKVGEEFGFAAKVVAVPSRWLVKSTSGKLARGENREKFLASPALVSTRPVVTDDGPRTTDALELSLAQIWAEVLGVSHVSITDNFFALGGDSLRAMVIACRAEQLGISLPVVLGNSTIERISAAHRRMLSEPRASIASDKSTIAVAKSPIARSPRSSHDPVPLSSSQRKWWWESIVGAGDAPVSAAFRLSGALDVAALEGALVQLIDRNAILRIVVGDKASEQRVVSKLDRSVLQVIDLRQLPRASQAGQVVHELLQQATLKMNMFAGVVFSFSLLRLDDTDAILSIRFNHIVSDRWSVGLFLRELSMLYNSSHAASSNGGALDYCDYALWEHSWRTSQFLASDFSYWENRLSGPLLSCLPGLIALGIPSRVSPAVSLSSTTVNGLRDIARTEEVSAFVVLATAFVMWLYRDLATSQICVNFSSNYRNQTELLDILGLFADRAILACDFSGVGSFREALHEVREALVASFAHSHVRPYEIVTRRQLRSHRKLFTALPNINMFEISKHDLSLSGVAATPYEVPDSHVHSLIYLKIVHVKEDDEWRVTLYGRPLSAFLQFLTEATGQPDAHVVERR